MDDHPNISATSNQRNLKEDPDAEPPARCIDLSKVPVSRRQRRKTLVIDQQPEDKCEAQLNLAAPRRVSTPNSASLVGILITSDTSAYVPPGNVHFTPPTAHHASSATPSSPSSAPDEVISPGIDSALLSTLPQSVFASLVRNAVFLLYEAILILVVIIILVLVVRMV